MKFKHRKNFITVRKQRTTGTVHHMEVDLQTKHLNSTTILFSDHLTLRKTQGTDVKTIVGRAPEGYEEGKGTMARFWGIKCFAQLNRTQIVVVDYGNHCLRMVNRETQTTEHFFGDCKKIYTKDGLHFQKPYSVLFDKNSNSLLVTVTDANMVYRIDIITKSPKALVAIAMPVGMERDGNDFYFTSLSHKYITKYDSETNATTKISAVNKRQKKPRELILTKGLILVADEGENEIRILELGETNSTCSWPAVYSDNLQKPASLLLLGDTLYIGQYNAIDMVNGEEAFYQCFQKTFKLKVALLVC